MSRRRNQNQIPGHVMRQLRHLQTQIMMGDDDWSYVNPVMVNITVLLLLAFLVGGCALEARGDLIIEVTDVNARVCPDTNGYYGLSVDVGRDLAGEGLWLGTITFQQPEYQSGLGPYMEFGPSSYSTGVGQQSLEWHLMPNGYLRTLHQGIPIGSWDAYTDAGYLPKGSVPGSGIQGSGAAVGDSALFVPFVWSSWADIADSNGSVADVLYSGVGWVSLTNIEDQFIQGSANYPAFTVGQIVLSTFGDLMTGQTELGSGNWQAVPEPGQLVVFCVGFVVFWWFYWRRRSEP